MIRCPACNAEFDFAEQPSGKCPRCGTQAQRTAQRTVGDLPSDNDNKSTMEHSGSSLELELVDESQHRERDPENVLDDSMGTIELPSTGKIEPRKPATVGNIGDQTIDLGSLGPSTKNRTHAIDADHTIDLGSADSELLDKLNTSWSGTHYDSTPQHATIKQDEGSNAGYRSTLPVKSRSLRPRDTVKFAGRPTDSPDYELLDMIGEGGMGVVYAAHQSSIARTVAVKMLKSTTDVSDEHRDKFISEAVVTGELDHPNIVPIYDLGANDEGALFYSMKRVKGTPWEDVLKQKSLDENLNILLRVADAVAFAHANGVVHRDLKPENVMLGDFGEVLVMDWGLARVTEEFPSSGSIYQTNTLGGTPAYMAPEMARGPVEHIDERSDIYLLGAILYEVIGGKAPHTGRDVMQCLMAAAQNRLDPIDYQGELLDIACQAMATQREDRFQTVKAFQQAVRTYQSHSESLLLTGHAERHLANAEKSGDYQQYARAMYGFQESLALWEGNSRAQEKLLATELAYAKLALKADDLDLAESLLSDENAEHGALLTEIRSAQAERRARQRMMQRLRWLVAGLGVALLVGGVISYVAISMQYNEAVRQKGIAEDARDAEEAQRKVAEENERIALDAKQEADEQREIAEMEEAAARKAEGEARDAQIAEAQQREIAENNERAARIAEQAAVDARNAEEYESYVATIGLAAAKVDENAYGFAQQLLDDCPIELRNWEWGRLNYLCQLSDVVLPTGGQVAAVAWSPDGSLVASGDWSGALSVRDAESHEVLFSQQHGQYVHAVAFSPNGQLVASGSSDGRVRVVRANTGEQVLTIDAHREGVLSVAFSPAGSEIISTSFDNSARLWNASNGAPLQTLVGHNWWVWSAAFAPGGNRIVTASQDSHVIVWQRSRARANFTIAGEFTGHDGPVYDATFSPAGNLVASGGYDGRVCLWRPDQLSASDLARQIESGNASTTGYQQLNAHSAAVRSVSFDSTGERLLSGGHDNVVWLWDVRTGQSIKALRGHASRVESVAFAPDGNLALSGGQDDTLRIWNVADYEESRVLRGRVLDGHYDAVLSARFGPTGKYVATASRDRTAQLYDASTGKMLRRFDEGHEFLATTSVFFADGRRLATGAGDNSVRLWNVQTGAQLAVLRSTGRSGTLAVAPGGVWLATGGPNNSVQLWSSESGQKLAALPGHEAEVTAAAINSDGTLLATGDERGDIRLWQVDPAGQSAKPSRRLKGHSRTITALEFTPLGDTLVSSSGDRTCGQWDVASGREVSERVLKHPAWVASVDVSGDGRRAVTTCEDGTVRVWSLPEARIVASASLANEVVNSARFAPTEDNILITSWAARKVWQWTPRDAGEMSLDALSPAIDFSPIGGLLWAADYTPDGRRILTIGGNDARLWSLAAGQANTVLRFSPHGAVAAVDVSTDGKWLATGSWDTTTKIWNIETAQVVRKLVGGHSGYINSVAFAPNAERIATAGDDGRVCLWDVASGERLSIDTIVHDRPITSVAFSPDGAHLLTASADGTAKLWRSDNGQLVREFSGHKFGLLTAVFSRDGQQIATGGEDNTARIWSTATGEEMHQLGGHTSSVTSVAFNADGTRLLTASQDNTAKLWDASTGKEVLTLSGHTRELTAVGFSPDGRTALTASRDGTAILWPATKWQGEE